MYDGEADIDDDNNNYMAGDLVGKPCGIKGPRGSHGPKGPQRTMKPVSLVYMNLYVRIPIFWQKMLTAWMPIKTCSPEKCKSIRADGFKPLEIQIDRIAEVMDKMKTKPQWKQNK